MDVTLGQIGTDDATGVHERCCKFTFVSVTERTKEKGRRAVGLPRLTCKSRVAERKKRVSKPTFLAITFYNRLFRNVDGPTKRE